MGMTLWDYHVKLAQRIAQRAASGAATRADWEVVRNAVHADFLKSVGLHPMPERCDLRLTDRGEFSGAGYRARRLAWQILPDCWATGCLYTPDPMPAGKLPAVLYACGHDAIGVVGYQGHALMWARRGYACLVFDTIEQHDNPGDHHGLYYGKRYDLVSMGYCASGGEIWNSIRALDVLSATPGVDPGRIGVTGNSGGGAHSFYLAVADSRVRAAASSCGVASIEQTLRDRHLMGHCDCMYFYNVGQRDMSDFAALVAPRPLLFCFASQDVLFSRDEYRSLVDRTRRVYKLFGCEDNCQLFEAPGPHGYRPETIEVINRWFDRHVAGEERPSLPIQQPENEERTISVFQGRPPEADRLDVLPELMSRRGSFELPAKPEDWPAVRDQAKQVLRREALRLLDADEPLTLAEVGSWLSGTITVKKHRGELGGVDVWVEAYIRPEDGGKVIVTLAEPGETATDAVHRLSNHVNGPTLIGIETRGSGFRAGHAAVDHHLLRAGMLTGMPITLLTIQDLRHLMKVVLRWPFVTGRRVFLHGGGDRGVACLYHALYDEGVAGVVAVDPPASHRDGAYMLGILRVADIEHVIGLMCPRPVGVLNMTLTGRSWAARAYRRAGVPDRLITARHNLGAVFAQVLNAPA